MNVVLDTIIKKQTAELTETIQMRPSTKVVRVLNRDVKNYDFKRDTSQLVDNLTSVKELGPKYLKTLALIDYDLPDMPLSIHVDINQKFNNTLYMTLLKKYQRKQDGEYQYIPIIDKELASEKNHAFNMRAILKSLKADKVYYESKSNKNHTRNLLVKSAFAHQNYCFVTGEQLNNDNMSIDHLVPLNSKHQTHLINGKNINDICNLGKMGRDANSEKQHYSLLEYHYKKGGFKFYPVNVLYLLHMQLEVVKREFIRSPDVQKTHNLIKEYVKQYQNVMGSINNITLSINNLPKDLFGNISKQELVTLINSISK